MRIGTFVVLGLMGESGSGKDFSAAWIIQNQGYVRVGFADVLKRFCQKVFEFSDESLWGDPKFRNEKVCPCNPDNDTLSSDSFFLGPRWDKALKNFTENVDEFIDSLPLIVEEKADYRGFLKRWFWECENRSERKLISPRLALQLLGTEYGRGFKQTLWSDHVFEKIIPMVEMGYPYGAKSGLGRHCSQMLENVRSRDRGVIITDVRFRTELEAIQGRGGYVIKIVRLAHKDKENEAEKAGIAGHASEAEQRDIPDEAYDVVLEMGEGADNVYPRLEKMFEEKEWELRNTESEKGSSTEPSPRKKDPTGDTSKS